MQVERMFHTVWLSSDPHVTMLRMPISPADYGEDWPDFSFEIVWNRARGRCECRGGCGGQDGHLADDGRCRNRHGQARWRGNWWQRPVILSLAHLDHNPSSRDRDRVAAYCEGCHLRHDARQHWATRRRNDEVRRGVLPLFDVV